MSKWRPSESCLYVIGDVHGAFHLLKSILGRILPLRHTGGSTDKIIWIGDYWDRNLFGPEVTDLTCQIQQKYPDQSIFLRGNHDDEWCCVLGLGNYSTTERERAFRTIKMRDHSLGIDNGGLATIQGFLNRTSSSEKPEDVTLSHMEKMVPEEHKKFLVSTILYYELPGYRFVHAGCNPNMPLVDQPADLLLWDRNLFEKMKAGKPMDWDDTIVCGHSGAQGPLFRSKYLMIDAGSPKQLMCTELNSRQAYLAVQGNERLKSFKIPDEDIVDREYS